MDVWNLFVKYGDDIFDKDAPCNIDVVPFPDNGTQETKQ